MEILFIIGGLMSLALLYIAWKLFLSTFSIGKFKSPYLLQFIMKKYPVIIVNEKYPNSIKKLTYGYYGSKGLFVPDYNQTLVYFPHKQDVFFLLELSDGSLVPTYSTVIQEKDKKKLVFLKKEFDAYEEILQSSIEKADIEYKAKKTIIKDSLASQIKENLPIISIFMFILILSLAVFVYTISYTNKFMSIPTKLEEPLKMCQTNLHTCLTMVNSTNVTHHSGITKGNQIFNEVISGD